MNPFALRQSAAEHMLYMQAEGKLPDTSAVEATQKRLSRITGDGMRREGLFTKRMLLMHEAEVWALMHEVSSHWHLHRAADENWLREADLDFFARGPSEAEVPQSAEEATVVRVSCCACCRRRQGKYWPDVGKE